ncbi:MAG: molybdopterin cofactor-binding domain-containing protein [Parvularculaceae bacterium]
MFTPDPLRDAASAADASRNLERGERRFFAVDRRAFLAASGSLVVAVSLAGRAKADATAGGLANVRGGDATPSLFVAIAPDDRVAITCHRSEMGQQTWTAMAQIIADELEAEWSRIEIVQAEGHPRYGDQNTDGSRSVRRNLHRLRVVGAAMRAMLTQAAAAKWGVDPAACSSAQNVVGGPDGQSARYGELAAAAAELAPPAEADIVLKDRADWRYIGKEIPSLTVPMIVRGEGVFGQDVRLDDMAYAVVARPPRVLSSPAAVDDAKALGVPGVLRTVRLPALAAPAAFKPLGGVAVIAEDTWSAIKGRRALKVDWTDSENADYDSDAFADAIAETARQPGETRRNRGDVDRALADAATRVEAEYYVPHLSQSPMEPPAATARWVDGRVECWACVQAPQAARNAVAQACGIEPDDVTINVTLLGGGFGRKSKPDFVAEAALIAREVGRPTKVIWTREDDLQHGYYHSVSAQRLEGGLAEAGRCTAWLHRTVFPPIPSTFQAGVETPSWGELRLGATDNPFATPNLRLESGDAPAKVRIGWLRSVANVYHAFAVQSFADELAFAAGRDPKDYLLELIGEPRLFDPNTEGAEYDNYGDPLEEYPIDTGRLANVVRKVGEMAKWGRTLPSGSGLGIAAHRSFLSYVATVVEARVDDDGRLTIPNVWSAIDAGVVVNRRHTEAQVEGGTLYGLSNALFGAITARNGAVEQANFPDWRLMRINEAPRRMSVTIIDSDAPPGGVGEPPTPPAAPALTNAIFAATGVRVRRLPIFEAGGPDRLDLSQAQAS